MVTISDVEKKTKNSINQVSCGEMEALSALCDTFLPSIDVSEDLDDHLRSSHLDHINNRQSLIQFYQTSASMAGTPHRVRF